MSVDTITDTERINILKRLIGLIAGRCGVDQCKAEQFTREDLMFIEALANRDDGSAEYWLRHKNYQRPV